MAQKVVIEGTEIRINKDSYICITDLAKTGQGRTVDIIRNYVKNRNNLEVLYLWEKLYNPDFNCDRADTIKENIHRNDYVLGVKDWIEETGAVGIVTKAGRYGGTYAHQDIATDFARWLRPSFALWLVREFARLKNEEAKQLGNPWNVRREIAKANHFLQTDAIRTKLIPGKIKGTKQEGLYFANEADLLNMVIFGYTAKEWKAANPKKKGNQRDHASILQLAVLANLEALNSKLIEWDCEQEQRFELLSEESKRQTDILSKSAVIKRLNKE